MSRLVAGCAGSASQRKTLDHEEDRSQIWLIDFVMLAWFVDRFGERRALSDYLYAIPNGGRRTKIEAARLKRMGVKAGVHDLHLPVPMVHAGELVPGLWVEMKSSDGTLSKEQRAWRDRMIEQGFLFMMCRSWKSAAETLSSYLGGLTTKTGQPLRVY